MANLALIPARGGSKRIPGKNIKPFAGKPIIAYSIEAAKQAGIFDEIMVSTDDAQIAEIAKQYGSKVPFFRSAKNSDDFATTVDVILEVLDEYAKIGIVFEHVCCIYPTAPLLQAENIMSAMKLLSEQQFDSVFTSSAFSYPIQRAIKKLTNGKIELFQPEHLNSRSQDLEKAYHDAGQFYLMKTTSVLQHKKIWTSNTGTIVLDEMQVQDIDNEMDWKLAELKYQFLNSAK